MFLDCLKFLLGQARRFLEQRTRKDNFADIMKQSRQLNCGCPLFWEIGRQH